MIDSYIPIDLLMQDRGPSRLDQEWQAYLAETRLPLPDASPRPFNAPSNAHLKNNLD